MFDIGFSEILLILIVSCLVVNPKKLPTLVKEIRIYYKKFIAVKHDIIDIVKNVDLEELYKEKFEKDKDNEIEHKTSNIIGDDGKIYEAYDLNDLKQKNKKKK